MLTAAKVPQTNVDARLAILGGEPVRKRPMPMRAALGADEERIIKDVIEYYRERRLDPGYQGEFEKRYTDAFVAQMGGGLHAERGVHQGVRLRRQSALPAGHGERRDGQKSK